MHTGYEARPNGIAPPGGVLRRARRGRRGADRHRRLLAERRRQPRPAPRAVFDSGRCRESIRSIPRAVHDAGGRIVLQLLHSGRYGFHERIVAPSAVKSPINPLAPREMTAAEIEQTIEDFARAAVLAREAGYDGVEVMGSEGYLITQFLAARTNHRARRMGRPAREPHALRRRDRAPHARRGRARLHHRLPHLGARPGRGRS